MPSLKLTLRAELDLLDAHAWIARRNAQAASRMLHEIRVACDRLAEFPGLGRERDDLKAGMRMWVVGRYLILYRIESDGVLVVRVVYGSRDLRRLFPKEQA